MLSSLFSYIFLNNTVASSQINPKASMQIEDSSQNTKQEVVLPDVKVIKAIIEKGKDFLPAS